MDGSNQVIRHVPRASIWYGADPAEAVAGLSEDDSVDALHKRADLVARRLEMVGRVNLLATEELSTLRERYEFMNRELEDVKAARRDLLQAKVARGLVDEARRLSEHVAPQRRLLAALRSELGRAAGDQVVVHERRRGGGVALLADQS